jgi:hypothetical protein
MNRLYTLVAGFFDKMNLSTGATQTFVTQNLIATSFMFIVAFGSGFRIFMLALQGKKARKGPSIKIVPAHLSDPVSMFPPGMQIDTVLKKWASSAPPKQKRR